MCVFVYGWLMSPANENASIQREPMSSSVTLQRDWTRYALKLIEQEERATLLGPTSTHVSHNGGNALDLALATTGVQSAPTSQATTLRRPVIFRGGPERTGVMSGPGPLKLAPFWEYKEENEMYCASPCVANGRVFGTSILLDPPKSFGTVFCLDESTGEKKWLTHLKDGNSKQEFKGIFSSPALSGDGKYLVVGQGLHSDAGCELICLDAHTGRIHWLVKTPLHIEGSPAIEGDIAVAGAGAIEVGEDHKPRGDANGVGHPGMVIGVRISDGRELFRYPVPDPESSPVVEGGVAYIGSGLNGNAVYALRTAPDEELKAKNLERLVWRVPAPFPASGPVTLAGELVLVGCGKGDFVFADPNPEGLLLAIDRATGKERFRVALPDAVLGAIAVRDGIAICPIRNGEVFAIDLRKADGNRILWRAAVNGSAAVLAGTAFTGSLVYAVSQDGYMAILDARDGTQLERVFVNGKGKPGEMGLSVSAPVLSNGRVFLGSETGGLRCYIGKESRP